jgi:hypothetical protein
VLDKFDLTLKGDESDEWRAAHDLVPTV